MSYYKPESGVDKKVGKENGVKDQEHSVKAVWRNKEVRACRCGCGCGSCRGIGVGLSAGRFFFDEVLAHVGQGLIDEESEPAEEDQVGEHGVESGRFAARRIVGDAPQFSAH